MAETARQKRMRELGVTSSSSPSMKVPSTTSKKSLSQRELRKIELGAAPDTRVPEPTLDEIRLSQRQNQKSVGFTPKPFSEDPMSSYPEPKKSFAETAQSLNAGKTDGKRVIDTLVFNDLNRIAKNPTVNKVADVARSFVTGGGAGAANVAGFAGGVASKVAALLPSANKVVKGAITGGITGFPLGVGQYQATGGDDTEEALKQGALGAVLGGAGSLLGSAASKGIEKIVGRNTTNSPSYEGLDLTSNVGGKNKSILVANDFVAASRENAEPMKQNWHDNLFGNQGLGISAFSDPRRISKDPINTAGQIVRNPLKSDVQGVKEQIKATSRATYQNFVDVNAPLKHISKETYEKSLDASRANNIANTIVSDKFVNPQGEVIGEGLTNTFKKVARGQTDKFLDYIVLRHAKTRMQRGERVYTDNLGMTPEKAQERIDTYNKQHPEFADIAKEWDQFNENTLKTYGVDEGLMTPEMFTMLREQNPNYASMRRQFSTSEKFASPFSMGAKPSFSGQKAPIKEVSPTGSVRRIVDPRRSAVEATGAWVNAAMRNRVMTSIVDRVKVDPENMKGIVEIVQPPKGQRDLAEVLSTDGAEGFLESLDGDFNALFSRTSLDKDNIVRAMVKGKPVYMKVVNPEAVKALIGMGSEQSNIVMDVFGKLSNATKYGATGALAPLFAVKGLTTDIAQSIIQSKNPAAHLWDLGHAMISSIADTLPKGMKGVEAIRGLAQDYRRSGGEFSAALRGNRPLNKSVSRMDRNPILSPQGIATGVGKTIAAPFKALNKVSDIAENLNRMAGAKGELRRLGGQRTPDNVMKAMAQGREVTTNFSRKGSKSQNIEKFIPYSNAAIQGMYRFAKAWKQNPVKTAAVVGGAVMIPKAIEYFKFHNDPDYQNIPARDKYRNMIVSKNADGTFVKVPMPVEYNALGAFMVDSLEKWKDGNEEAFKGAADAITNAYTPPIVSGAAQGFTQGGGIDKSMAGALNATVMAPYAALQANKSFTGAPIEPMGMQGSPKYRYDERTSSVAKKLGEVLNYSPKKIDYLIRAYGGDPARLVLPLTSEIGGGTPRNTLLKNFIVDPTLTNNLSTDFYAAKEKITQVEDDFRDHGIPLPKWYNEGLSKDFKSTAKGSYNKKLSQLSDEKKLINANKSISRTERAEQYREVQEKINEIYLELNAKAHDMGVLD